VDDNEIIRDLSRSASQGRSAELGEPPAHVLDAAYQAGIWAGLEAELAQLVADSADDPTPVGVRGVETDVRQLSYRFAGLTLECELGPDDMVGHIRPPGEVRLDLVAPNGSSRPVPLDSDGRFLVRPRPRGPVAVRCTRPDGSPALTPWFLA
jgi:hypothetical protein